MLPSLAVQRHARTLVRVLLAGIVLACAYLAFARLDRPRLYAVLSSAKLGWFWAGVFVEIVVIVVRTERWRAMLDAPLSRLKLNEYLFVAFGLGQILPAGTTEALRVYLLRKRHGVSVPVGTATMLLEKFFEGAGIIPLVAPLPWLMRVPPWVALLVYGFCAAGTLATALLVVLTRASLRLRWRVFQTVAWQRVVPGLRCLLEPRVFVEVMVQSVVAHALDCVGIWCFFQATGVEAPFVVTALVTLMFSLALVVPFVPGHVGVFEASAVGALELAGVGVERAVAFGLIAHAAQLVIAVAALPGVSLLREAGAPREA